MFYVCTLCYRNYLLCNVDKTEFGIALKMCYVAVLKRVPDLSHSTEKARSAGQSKTVLQLNDCGVYNTKTNTKMERGSVETDVICVKVEAEPEMKPGPKTKKTRKRLQVDTVRRLGQKSRRKKMQNEPFSAVQVPIKQTTVTPSGRRGGRKKRVQIVQTRLLPVPIKPKIVPSTTVPDQQEKPQLTKPSRNNLQHSKESIPVADASGQSLKKASMPSGYYMVNQASLQQPAAPLHPCSSGQQTVVNSCQNPVFIQVCGSQLASSSFNSANQLACHPVVLPQNSVSIQLAGNTVVPGISLMPGNLSLNPQLQFQSSGSLMNNQGSLQFGIHSNQIVQTLHNSLNSFTPNHLVQGNFQKPIHIQIPANQVIQTNSQNQVQINFSPSQLIQSNIQNPIQVRIPSTQLVHSGSQNTVQISSPSNQLVQNSIQIQIPARQLLQTNPKIPGPTLLPSLQSVNSKIEMKSPIFIKAKLPKQSVTILPSSPLIQNATGHPEVQTCAVQANLQCDSLSQAPNMRYTRSKPLSKVVQIGRKPRKPKYSTRANTSSKVAAHTQKPVCIQPHSVGTPKFIPIQPSISHVPQHSNLQNSLQVQVVNSNVLNTVQHQFPLQLGVPISRTMLTPSTIEKPAVVQVARQRLETSQSSTSKFRIVPANRSQPETAGATTGSRLLDSSKSLVRTKLRGRALQTAKQSASENSRLCKIATRQLNTSVLPQKCKSLLPKHDSSKTNLQHRNLGSSGHQLKQLALPGCEVAQLSGQLTVQASSLPTYTIVTSGRNLQPNMNLPNAQVLGTCSQVAARSRRPLQGVREINKNKAQDISSKETVIVLGTSNFNKSSDAQRFSVSAPNVVNSISQSTNAVPQCKAKSKYVPILPRPSDNQMCIFSQTSNDKGSFWGAGKKQGKLVVKAVKRRATTAQKSDEDEQELLAGQKCFVELEMLNVEPNKFYSASDFKKVKSSNLQSRSQQTVKNEPTNVSFISRP